MGIRSTQYVTRDEAISRITAIADYAICKNYRRMEVHTFESNRSVEAFINEFKPIDLSNIDNWSNTMLEDLMDQPFYRYSQFDNYLIKDE